MTKRAFSLVEVLIAVAIFSLISLSAVSLLSLILHSQLHQQAVRNVEAEGNYALYQITQSIRNASSVTSPVAGASGSSLTLAVVSLPAENPTVISVSGTTISLKKGTNTAVVLTSPDVQVTSLTVANITASGSKGSVRVSITLANTHAAAHPEASYSETFYTTVSLR
jgi:prepilin-type N-terminal cleavage/methylation domain-containing protein